jgi:hypothetical protein
VEKTLAVGGYRDLPHAEDADLWWRLALRYDIHLIPDVLIGFRHNASSISSRNTYSQELHGLYIQYLLLSHLSGLEPMPLADVSPALEAYIPASRLEAKQQLRFLNMHLAARRYGSALAALARSVFASPSYLIQRMIDELFPLNFIANGISPDLFHGRKEVFWP